jgi:hypothetical protein
VSEDEETEPIKRKRVSEDEETESIKDQESQGIVVEHVMRRLVLTRYSR